VVERFGFGGQPLDGQVRATPSPQEGRWFFHRGTFIRFALLIAALETAQAFWKGVAA